MRSNVIRRKAVVLALPPALCLLTSLALPAWSAPPPVVHAVEIACRKDRQAGLALLQGGVDVLPEAQATALRLEHRGGNWCVRLGQAATAAELARTLAVAKAHFPGAALVTARADGATVVARVEMRDPAAQAGADAAPPRESLPAAATQAEPDLAEAALTEIVRGSDAAGLANPLPPIRLAAATAEVPAPAAAAKPDAVKPESTKPETVKPETAKPDAGKADAAKADAGMPGAGRPGGVGQAQDKPAPETAGAASEPMPFWARLAILAVLAGGGAAAWRNWKRRRPVAGPAAASSAEEPVTLMDPPSLSEADERRLQENLGELAMVQGNILSVSKGRRVKALYVTSCHNGEGKTRAAIGLAHGLAINKARVLLVDGNPRAPVLDRRYHMPGVPGLCEYLCLDCAVNKELVRATKYPNLSVMPFGGKEYGRPDLLGGNKLESFLETLGGQFDYVIMDGHSMTGSDTNIIACKFDGIVLAVQCARTKWEVVRLAAQKMTLMGGTVLGVVLNRRQYYIPKFLYKTL